MRGQHRPGPLAQEPLVAGDVGIEGEGEGDVQADMVLPRRALAAAGGGFLSGRGGRLPWEAKALLAAHLGVVADTVEVADAEVQQRVGGGRLQHAEQGRGEGVHVPHHVSVVVVIVAPGGQAEDRGGGRRSGVHRGVQVIEGGVRQRLPLLFGPDQPDAPAPDIGPGLLVAAADVVEPERLGPVQQAHRLGVGLMVQH